MKIYVVGTCQAVSLEACLSVMLPDVQIERRLWNADFRPHVAPGDVVFRHRHRRTVWTQDELRDGEMLVPRIWFNAFHPDVVYIAGPDGAVPSPLGDYHSSLILYAWLRGMSKADAAKLFCEAVFERLQFFDRWNAAKTTLLEEGRDAGVPLDALLARWERAGCFVRTPNHPILSVMADIARVLVSRAGLVAAVAEPEYFIGDPMLDKAMWPVYPAIAQRFGLQGVYAFKAPQPPGGAVPILLDLEEFIARSYDAYAAMAPSALACGRLENPLFRDLESLAASERTRPPAATEGNAPAAPRRARDASPYAGLPPFHFWRRAVERVAASEVDPVGAPPFLIDRDTRIATAGSCFAQNMSGALARRGFNYVVAEPAPDGVSPDDARRDGYGVFSTRSGNIYTARQLLQLFDRAYGTFAPEEPSWLRPDGRYADPFRAQIEPAGFAAAGDVIDARQRHFAAVRAMFEQLDVLIFTLGLTEAWRSRVDGAVFSAAPGVVAGRMDPERHEFVNFTAAEVESDLAAFLARLAGVNPGARMVLTVSPQPPIATYAPRHVLVSATFTKAALRVAADEIERTHANVWYFPAYELVAGSFNRGAYYERDLRTVTHEGVEHVMRLFLEHATAGELGPLDADARLVDDNRDDMDVVCDEDAAGYDGAPSRSAAAGGTVRWAEYDEHLDREYPVRPTPGERAPDTRVMEPLEPASMRARVTAELPVVLPRRTVVSVACTVENGTDVTLVGAGRNPVFLCYRWFDAEGNVTEVGRSIHTPLPSLAPGAAALVAMRIATPQFDGTYVLRVALLQSDVAWFDDVDPANGLETAVDVFAARAPVSTP